MGYSKATYSLARDRLYSRRQKAESIAEFKRRDVYNKVPRIKEIDEEVAKCGILAAKAVVQGGNVKEALESLKFKSLALQGERRTLLATNGFPDDYMDTEYYCTKCNDTGEYEHNNKTLVCDCYKKMLTEIAYEELNSISPLQLSTFESFDLNLYSMDVEDQGQSPYNRMSKIFEYCRKYAAAFTDNSPSLLLRGATGLGKTHLSLAIANEVIKKGYGVVYMSAPVLLSKLEKEHFSGRYTDENHTQSLLQECDLLIIDDLGTEFATQFTKSAIYNIFNTRILQGKPIIFNTNLTIKELEIAYTQRFVSRVMGNCTKLDLIGKDIRASRGSS